MSTSVSRTGSTSSFHCQAYWNTLSARPSTPMVRNFALIYLQMAHERSAPETQFEVVGLAPVLLTPQLKSLASLYLISGNLLHSSCSKFCHLSEASTIVEPRCKSVAMAEVCHGVELYGSFSGCGIDHYRHGDAFLTPCLQKLRC